MIGIYGGTFNPVHFGHLRTAIEVKEAFKLKEMRLIPCRLPVHRAAPSIAAEHRLNMLKLAITATPGLSVDSRELDRAGPSYMIDTLRSLRAEFTDTPLLLIVGTDAFIHIESWREWQQLFTYAHLVVITRPDFVTPVLNDFLAQRLQIDSQLLAQKLAGYLFFQTVTQLDISATKIRQLIANGYQPKFLLPDNVLAYINHHHLFQTTH